MRKAFTLPVAALFVVACTDSTAPENYARSAESIRGPAAALSLSEGFENGVSTAGTWSPEVYSTSPGTKAKAATTFLGRFADQVVTLRVPAGSTNLTITFDVYVIGSWDGAGLQGFGGDQWQVEVERAGVKQNLFHTSFSNQATKPQHYPKQVTDKGTRPNGTKALALNSLGYPKASAKFDVGDAIYRMTFTVSNPTGGEVVFHFHTTTPLQGEPDESWGLDNVQVTGN